METKWLAIQSFKRNQILIDHLNKLLIFHKLNMLDSSDEIEQLDIEKSKIFIESFLKKILDFTTSPTKKENTRRPTKNPWIFRKGSGCFFRKENKERPKSGKCRWNREGADGRRKEGEEREVQGEGEGKEKQGKRGRNGIRNGIFENTGLRKE